MASVVMVVNCGSSSVKLDVFLLPSEVNPLSVHIDRVGKLGTRLTIAKPGLAKEGRAVQAADVRAAVGLAIEEVTSAGFAVDIVGHRVVHGGDRFSDSVKIDEVVLEHIRACVPLAPLHNPANLAGIEVARARWPQAPQVAVFDTAFHQTLAPEAYLYAIPRSLHDELGVRRYGFHGTSHRYVAERAAVFLGRASTTLRLVTLHLGNGCSACAIDGGRSVDTSMGMTPLEGLVMGTRSGDLDPAVVLLLARARGIDEVDRLLNHDSGLLGLSGKSNDMRDLERVAAAGDSDADLAIKVFTHRVRKVVGGYAAVLGGLDAVVFTGGIGENSVRVRRDICRGLQVLGAQLDERKNEGSARGERDIASGDSRARLLVLPTDEELAIARDALRLTGC